MEVNSIFQTHWENESKPPIITKNFSRLVIAFNTAIVKKEIVGVVSPAGTGFKFALKAFARKHYLKVIYANMKYNESIREVCLDLIKELCNVKFSNLNHRDTTLFEVTKVFNARLAVDDAALLCIDTNSALKPQQLKYFIRFLNDFNKPIGLVFRINKLYMEKVSSSKQHGDSFLKLQSVVDNWRVLEPPSEEEIKNISRFYGITDPILIDDLIKSCDQNLSTLKRGIDRIQKIRDRKNSLPKT